MKRWRRIAYLAVALFSVPASASGQAFGPAHQHHATAGVSRGGINARPAFNRRLLGIVNNSSAALYCTVDGTDAGRDTGWHLAAQGTTGDRILFDRQVPQGPVRCYCASAACGYLLIEGR